nr:DUF4386 family protein [Ktedonobacterales bacterium]
SLARAMLVLAAALNLIPLAYTGLFLAPGTAAGGDADARLHFIATHATLWSVGWLMWMGGSLGFVLSIWTVTRAFVSRTAVPNLLRFAPIVALIGGTVDVVGDAIQVTAMPTLAQAYVSAPPGTTTTPLLLFDLADHLAALLSAGVANTVYFIAGVLCVVALARVRAFPRWLTVLGGAAWLATLAATPAVFFPAVLPIFVAGALFLYAAWLGGLAIWGIGGWHLRWPMPQFHRV